MTNTILVLMSLVISNGLAAEPMSSRDVSLAGQDLHVAAPVLETCAGPMQDWAHVMLLDGGVSVQIGDNTISGRSAVIWLQVQAEELAGYGAGKTYLARAYLEGNVSVQKGPKSKTTAVQHFMIEGAEVLVTQFKVTGEVFATSDSQQSVSADALSESEIYQRAIRAVGKIPSGPVIPPSAYVPNVADVIASPHGKPADKPISASSAAIAQQLNDATAPEGQEPIQEEPEYPIHLSALWEPVPQINRSLMPDGQEVFTASGRFYIWQKRAEGQILEFMADNMVIFTEPDSLDLDQQKGNQIGSGKARAAYLSGNIVMTEGEQTVRCDEVYYDFGKKRALAVNASMRMFDPERGVPIYLRAEKLGRVSEDIFEARNVVLTNSEFYLPQLSLNVSKLALLSGEALEQHHRLVEKKGETDPSDYEAHMVDVNARYKDRTLFTWPKMVANLSGPDTALKKIAFGNDSRFGTSVETRWHMAKLFGYREPDWMESEFLLDYFSKRGPGVGANVDWETEESFGGLIGYVMSDDGEDRLSRNRKNVASNEDIRGRFSFRHRQYLPEDWQLTLEASYVSDRNFLESMYRSEFYNDKGQETLVYLKRLKDNWAFSILTKMRINNFETMTEELPSIEYHLAGQSFWDHRFTFYSDNQIARFREKYDEDAVLGPQATSDYYTFGWTRNEVDLPLMFDTVKFVPFAAGSFSYEDSYGYQRDLDYNPMDSEDQVYLGEVGFRASTMFWKENPHLRSSMWDLNGMRHVITPYAEAVLYESSDEVFDQRNTVHVGVTQRWQTHRGSEEHQRTLDWMRLDLSATWVSNQADDSISPTAQDPYIVTPGGVLTNNAAGTQSVDPYSNQLYGPAAFVYNDPSIPFLRRRNNSYFGIARDTLNGEYVWRVSDTFSLLSDINYDIDDSQVQQFDIGVSRYVHPDISYYVGTRYLRPILVPVDEDEDGIYEDMEEGSNSFVAAITYRLSPRYIATFSQEYNFEFGEMIRSDLTFVRQYHRLFYALTFSLDESLDTSEVVFSIWPQGVRELAIGSRKHVGLTGTRWDD